MISWLVKRRRDIVSFGQRLRTPFGLHGFSPIVQLGFFVVWQFSDIARAGLQLLCEIPIHLKHYPMTSFQMLARRDASQSFLESYSQHLKRYRLSVATVLASLLLLIVEVYVATRELLIIVHPTVVKAYTTTVDLAPSWDDTSIKDSLYNFSCAPDTISYSCLSGTTPNILKYGRDYGLFADCNTEEFNDYVYRTALKFPTANIDDNAIITKVELIVQVEDGVSENVLIKHASSDAPDSWTCSGSSQMHDNLAGGTLYAEATWNTTGQKTVDLESNAVTDVQARIGLGQNLGISLTTTEPLSALATGEIDSVDGVLDPILRVTYTLPPQAPTNTNHSANTTASITWTWTDNATADTSNGIHDASHSTTCTTGAVSGTGSTGSCQETNLSANTRYARHPNVTDADGSTDGPSHSAYTSIETPTGVSFSGVTNDSVTVTADGPFSNLADDSSGLLFQNNTSLTNSGWVQTSGWTESGLGQNIYGEYVVTARNGDGDQTSTTAGEGIWTLPADPSVNSSRTTSAWYNTSPFDFTNAEIFGSGGMQYYRYAWNQSPTHVFNDTEDTWSDDNTNCPGASCTTANATLNLTSPFDGNTWYLHLRSYNGDDISSGTDLDRGPYYFDASNPTAPTTINDGTGIDADFSSSLTALSANWSAATDGTSGIQKYQYAIGSTAGGTEIVNWTDNGTDTGVTVSNLTLTNGQTYYASVRAVDNANNTGSAATSDGITVNTSLPTITDNQSGDTVPRQAGGTTYNVDFTKAATGPNLDYAQYRIWSGPGQTGTLIKDWTNIFTVDTASYTADWTVDFNALQQGMNYVSVRAVGLDALTTSLTDVFFVIKDTVAPNIFGITAIPGAARATVAWSTDQSATSLVEYGLTMNYGSQVSSSSLVTSHSQSLANLSTGTVYHYRVSSQDAAGNLSTSADKTFTTGTSDGGAPGVSVPVISNLESGDIIVDPAQLVSGTGPAEAAIFIVVDRMINTVVLSDGEGNFSVRLKAPLALGVHSLFVRARTAAGAVSDESDPITVTLVRAGIPVTVLERIIRDGEQPAVTFKAVAPTRSTVAIYLDGSLFKMIQAGPSLTPAFGFITAIAPPSNLADGRHLIHFVAKNANGIPSLPSGQTYFTKSSTSSGRLLAYANSTQYIVQPGDSLWTIAENLLGSGLRWGEIHRANIAAFPALATNPSIIQVGWSLTIPGS